MKMFTKPVLISQAILIAIHSISELISPSGGLDFTTTNYLIGLISNGLLIIFSVCLIKLARTEPGYKFLEADSQIELGIWGYLWRSVIVYIASIVFTVMAITLLKLPLAMPSIQYTLTFFIADIFVLMILSWLIFSKDRSGQLTSLFQVLRGW